MSKRTVFTTITPLPAGVTRDVVLETLHNHVEMIDLNPLVIERHVCPPPRDATAEEYHCTWYSLTDRVSYLPGVSGKVQYNACFHDLATGVQTHVYAPLGLDIKEKWSIGGSLPGEPVQPVELGLGVPKQGLYLREDCDMRCNIVMTKFVRGTLTKAHKVLVDRLVEKAGLDQVKVDNQRISVASSASGVSNPASLVGGSNDVTTAAGFPASPTLSSSGTFSDAASIDNIPSLISSNNQPPHYHEQPPTYAELPSLQPSLAAHQAQAQAAQQQRSSTPQVQDFEKQRPASGASATAAATTGEPFPPYADNDFVPEPLKPRKVQRHSYMAYQPAAYSSNANNNSRLSYAAYRPPPPQHGYSAYRPHSNVQQHHQQHLMPQQYPGHGRSHSAGAVPSAAVAPSPVELEG
ncbi:hypothetical protein DIS24_g11744 [Lasiodiplodia hormozganensis]|uniref:DUF7053 domain-containing protein n=1 Tax=Lasiodiplodia hormozganensis TaxID=869390 RepID=A0AA39WHJ7_9PEZI|nr:hypothetical protein DIS24_g11744 [Lasiodiplodia hormozganensis]